MFSKNSLIAIGGLLACSQTGCSNANAGSSAPPAPAPVGATASVPKTADPQVRSSQSSAKDRPKFDEKNAWSMLLKQCDFGPRPVGSSAHQKTRDFLLEEMKKLADRTIAQDFNYRGMKLTNIIGVFNPTAKRQILLCGHWDTRPRADMEVNEQKRSMPILGASDGASEIAVLLELSRMFKEKKPDVGVVVVFLDGEDYGDFDTDEGVFLGAKHFATNHQGYSPDFGILLDMVGDKDLQIYREVNSQRFAPAINNKVFRIAATLGYSRYFKDEVRTNVSDDHFALNAGGIPTIDLIDFDYSYWHTLDDKPANCSAQSLKIVGEVVAEVVYRESGR